MHETAQLAFSRRYIWMETWLCCYKFTPLRQQRVSASPSAALAGRGPIKYLWRLLLPTTGSPGRCRVVLWDELSCQLAADSGAWAAVLADRAGACNAFYTPCSSEPLCSPAFHLGNINPSFCTHFVIVYHPYLPKRCLQTSPRPSYRWDQLDAAWWGWRMYLGTSQPPQMTATDDEVLYFHCTMSQDWVPCLTWARCCSFQRGKLPHQSFPTGNDYAFVATEGAPWQAAQAPQVMAATGGAAEMLAFHRGAEKGGKCTICEPNTNSSG